MPPDGRLPDGGKDAKHVRWVFEKMGCDLDVAMTLKSSSSYLFLFNINPVNLSAADPCGFQVLMTVKMLLPQVRRSGDGRPERSARSGTLPPRSQRLGRALDQRPDDLLKRVLRTAVREQVVRLRKPHDVFVLIVSLTVMGAGQQESKCRPQLSFGSGKYCLEQAALKVRFRVRHAGPRRSGMARCSMRTPASN